MKSTAFYNVALTNGFWKDKQDLVYKTTLGAVYDRFVETGRVETMNAKPWSKNGNPAHVFWASDVFKWIEGAAYYLESHADDDLKAKCERIIDDVESAVTEDGYYNSYYNCTHEQRFSNRNNHELYTTGHMIEAGVAYAHATGDERFLNICKRNADLIDRIFRIEQSAAFMTPGHEEIELALIKLYRYTNEKRYLDLAEFFIAQRGANDKDKRSNCLPDGSAYGFDFQSHAPVTEQKEALGHAVRAMYLYSAVADLAKELQDPRLAETARTLFDNINEKKLYITGGIGATAAHEAFGAAYDLPNEAYNETCAALGLALFAGRLADEYPEGKFADVAERAIYNGMISGLSLSGDAFFYQNPLIIDRSAKLTPGYYRKTNQRVKVFECSCCPPNLVRMIPSIANLIYSSDDAHIFVHQFMANCATVDGETVIIETDYPVSGRVNVRTEKKKPVLRKPGWCASLTASAPYREENGYLYFEKNDVTVEFDMTPRFYRSSPDVHKNAGKVALTRGPIVYCMESQDQPADVFRCRADVTKTPAVLKEFFGGLPVMEADGLFTETKTALYAPVDEGAPVYQPCKLRLIPYCAFANRGEDDMIVWIEEA